MIDAHHHLWNLDRRALPFLDLPGHEPLQRSFGVDDLSAAAAPYAVTATVAVQAATDPAETVELLEEAERTPLVAGVVGWLDLDAADIGSALDGLLAHPAGRRLVGLRAMAQDHARAGWLASEPVAHAAAAIGARGRVCELLITPRETAAAAELVEGLPEVGFVIDHAGKPPIAAGAEAVAAWAPGIRRLGAAPNTVCKVSGLITEADWRTWSPEAVAPVVATVVEAFGEDRLLFGSDWPVCLLAGDYGAVVALARATLSALPADKVFDANARRVYGLADLTSSSPGDGSEDPT